jgi:hypothetical protein
LQVEKRMHDFCYSFLLVLLVWLMSSQFQSWLLMQHCNK